MAPPRKHRAHHGRGRGRSSGRPVGRPERPEPAASQPAAPRPPLEPELAELQRKLHQNNWRAPPGALAPNKKAKVAEPEADQVSRDGDDSTAAATELGSGGRPVPQTPAGQVHRGGQIDTAAAGRASVDPPRTMPSSSIPLAEPDRAGFQRVVPRTSWPTPKGALRPNRKAAVAEPPAEQATCSGREGSAPDVDEPEVRPQPTAPAASQPEEPESVMRPGPSQGNWLPEHFSADSSAVLAEPEADDAPRGSLDLEEVRPQPTAPQPEEPELVTNSSARPVEYQADQAPHVAPPTAPPTAVPSLEEPPPEDLLTEEVRPQSTAPQPEEREFVTNSSAGPVQPQTDQAPPVEGNTNEFAADRSENAPTPARENEEKNRNRMPGSRMPGQLELLKLLRDLDLPVKGSSIGQRMKVLKDVPLQPAHPDFARAPRPYVLCVAKEMG